MELEVAISTNAYSGYDLSTTFDHIAKVVGCPMVELDAIEGLFDHLDESRVGDPVYQRQVRESMTEAGVDSIAFSGHTDLSDPTCVPHLEEKFEFAAAVGARIYNTFAGPASRRANFESMIGPVAESARRAGLQLGLETQSQAGIVYDGKSGDYVAGLGLDNVGINFDFGNPYCSSNGKIDLLEAFRQALPAVTHVHLKDAVRTDMGWQTAGLEGRIVDYVTVFKMVQAMPRSIPMSIEVPLRLSINESGPVVADQPPTLEEIDRTLQDSLAYVRECWAQASLESPNVPQSG